MTEQRAAISEILRAIAASPEEGAPLERVLHAVLDAAARLCAADNASILRMDGSRAVPVAHYGVERPHPSLVAEYWAGREVPLDRSTVTGRVLMARRSVRITDIQADPDFVVRQIPGQDPRPNRSVLGVPLRRNDEILGILVLRRREVKAFTDSEVALAETFADQAAIAIENVRLFNETKEALEQQTATSEVLQSISRTAFDLQAVLDTVLQNAARLCDAPSGFIFKYDGRVFTSGSLYGYTPEMMELIRETRAFNEGFPATRATIAGRVALDRDVVQILDALADTDLGETLKRQAEVAGFRTMLGVPLIRDDRVMGVLSLRRNEVRAFTDREIALVRTFADQAAIAIENVRLFNETKEALQRQTATSEVRRSSVARHSTFRGSSIRSCRPQPHFARQTEERFGRLMSRAVSAFGRTLAATRTTARRSKA